MEKKNKGHLSREERQIAYVMRGRQASDSEIGKVLGRHRAVVSREFERNKAPVYVRGGLSVLERAAWAEDAARRRRSDSKRGKRGPLKLAAVRERIASLLELERYSPEKIAKLLSQSDLGVKVSGKTIRRWLNTEARELRQYLPQRGRKRRYPLTPKKGERRTAAAPEKRSIHERPEVIDNRERVGDLEGDTIVCRQSSTAILSVIDRKTRRRWFRKVPNLRSETVLQAMSHLLLEIPPSQRRTITFDRGSEFAQWKTLERLFGMLVYFCDSYCAWQKGSVEHSNKEFRVFVPKGTNLEHVSTEEVARIEQILNSRPMDCLGDRSPHQAWFTEGLTSFLH